MNNQNAYLIYLGSSDQYQGNRAFMDIFNNVEGKTQIAPGLFLGYSTHDLNAWYQALGNIGTTGSATGSVTMPVIIPVDVRTFQNVRNLPSYLTSFINQQSRAA